MKIQCPICGRSFDKFSTHILRSHKIPWEEFISTYGEYPKISNEMSLKMSKVSKSRSSESRSISAKAQWENPEFRNLMMESVHRQWENQEFRDKMKATGKNTFNEKLKNDPRWVKSGDNNPLHKFLTEMHAGLHPESLKRMKEGRYAYNISEENISRLNSHWSDPSKVEKARNRIIKNNRGTIIDYHKSDGSFVRLRSKFEYKLAKCLDDLNVQWEYESVILSYEYNNKIHKYITDFYIPSLNLIIEGKYSSMINDPIVQAKSKVAEMSPYNYAIVSSVDELVNLISSATTIESQSDEEILSVVNE